MNVNREHAVAWFVAVLCVYVAPLYFALFTDLGNEISAWIGPYLYETFPHLDCYRLATSPTSFMIKCNLVSGDQSLFHNARILQFINTWMSSTLHIDFEEYNCKCFYEPFKAYPLSEECKRNLLYHSDPYELANFTWHVVTIIMMHAIYRKIWYGDGIAEQFGISNDCLLSISVFDFGAFVCRREAEIK